MPVSASSYYKLKRPASILNSDRRLHAIGGRRRFALDRATWSPRAIRLALLGLILLMTTSAQAQRQAAATHIVRPGETLGVIAQSYGVDINMLATANGISNAQLIYSWQELTIPSVAGQQSALPAAGRTHVVRRGESLDSIAKAYGVALKDLIALNNVIGWLHPGDELALPATAAAITRQTSAPAIAAGDGAHIVRPGETLAKIAAAYDVSLEDLRAANNLWGWIIYPGQALTIPSGGLPQAESPSTAWPTTAVQAPAAPQNPATHTVEPGETLFRIAKRYDVPLDALIRANAITDVTRIHSGLVLRVSDLERAAPAPATATASPPPAAPPTTTVNRKRYVVQRGDSLSVIGARLNMSWQAIAHVNGITNPNALHAGANLLLPTLEEMAKYAPANSNARNFYFGAPAHPGPRVGAGREIVVQLSTQTAYAYENGILQKRALISSGRAKTPTLEGDFQVYYKVRSQTMDGPGYYLENVEWVMYFKWEYAFHGTYWHYNFGEPMSHGCVNMTNADAKWFYEFASIGTPVHVRAY